MTVLTKLKDLTIDALNDNKKLIIFLYALFIVTFIAAWILSADRIASIASNLGPMSNSVNNNAVVSEVTATELFIQNEWGGVVCYFSSILFGIPAIIILIYNAVNLGVIGQLFNNVVPNGGLKYLVYLLPHGIFEITATVFESVAGILLFLFIWNFIKALRSEDTLGFSDSFEKSKKILVQSIILFIISTILLIIAAPIEAYVSVPFSKLIVGF